MIRSPEETISTGDLKNIVENSFIQRNLVNVVSIVQENNVI